MTSIRSYRNALSDVKRRLSENVDVTAIGIGQKTTCGYPQPEYAFIVGVEKKGKPKGRKIAKSLTLADESFLTDVIEIPSASKSFCSNSLLDGSDLLISSVGRSGSLGVIGEDKDTGKFLGITASHVVAAPNQKFKKFRIESDAGGKKKVIGRVSHLVELSTSNPNSADLALVELNAHGRKIVKLEAVESIAKRITGVGRLSATTGGGSQRSHFYVARSNNIREIVECSGFTELRNQRIRDDITGLIVSFRRCFSFKTNRDIRSGHSGSLIIRERSDDSLAAVGLLFAGNRRTGYAISWTEMNKEFQNFNVEFK